MTEKIEKVEGHCPKCGGMRKGYVRATYCKRMDDEFDPTSASDTYYVLECGGCETLFIKNEYWFSEWDEFGEHPMTGEPMMIPGIRTTYWPSPIKRARPDWINKLEAKDEILGSLLNEMYEALNSDIAVLAAIGARTAFDRSAELLNVDPAITFAEKLDELVTLGKIGKDERSSLDALANAGSAAAHRGWKPTRKQLDTMLNILENFLYRAFFLSNASDNLQKSVPVKPKRKKAKKKSTS